MRVHEIEKQVATQYSAMQAFPSHGPSIDQMYSGENQRAALEMQIEVAKLLAAQDKKLEQMNRVLLTLLQRADHQEEALRQGGLVEEMRHKENTRLTRIAAWSGVASIVVAVILAVIGIVVQIAFK